MKMIMMTCDNCPLKLNLKGYREPQVYGNPFSNLAIIVPYIDTNNIEDDVGVKEIISIISSTGGDKLTYVIAPMLQCSPTRLNGYEVAQSYYYDCLKRTMSKFSLAKKHILLCGLEPSNIILSVTNINVWKDKVFKYAKQTISITYSPRIKLIDKDKGEVFTNNLIKWYNAAINDDYSAYEIL